MDTPLQLIGERCIQHEMLDSLLQIFNVIMGSHLRLKEGLSTGPMTMKVMRARQFDVELLLIGSGLPRTESTVGGRSEARTTSSS